MTITAAERASILERAVLHLRELRSTYAAAHRDVTAISREIEYLASERDGAARESTPSVVTAVDHAVAS